MGAGWAPGEGRAGDEMGQIKIYDTSSLTVLYLALLKGKSPNYSIELSQKSDFQLSTTKSNNIGHPTVKTGQIWTLETTPRSKFSQFGQLDDLCYPVL